MQLLRDNLVSLPPYRSGVVAEHNRPYGPLPRPKLPERHQPLLPLLLLVGSTLQKAQRRPLNQLQQQRLPLRRRTHGVKHTSLPTNGAVKYHPAVNTCRDGKKQEPWAFLVQDLVSVVVFVPDSSCGRYGQESLRPVTLRIMEIKLVVYNTTTLLMSFCADVTPPNKQLWPRYCYLLQAFL